MSCMAGQRATGIGPDQKCQIWFPCVRFSSILAKKAGIILCKASPDPILTALSCIGQTDLVWKQVGVQESSGPLLAERKRPATSFPLSDSVVFFHRQPFSWLHKAGVCKNHWARFWPMLPCWFRLDADQIQHVYWDIARLLGYCESGEADKK